MGKASASAPAPRSGQARWAAIGVCVAVAMLVLPLLLFALFSKLKLGFVSWSYYIPYEELSQALFSADLRKAYSAPLCAVNVTSGFVIANMFTYTLGHTAVSLVLAALVVLILRRYAFGRVGESKCAVASVGGATGGVFAATAASASAALTGCCGSGMAGGLVALAGLGSVIGAVLADVATWAQLVLMLALGAWLWLGRRSLAA